MTDKQTGGPAFPLHNHGAQTLGLHVTGMTLRDYFAAKAMQGLLAGTLTPEIVWSQSDAAETAYNVADAMLKARDGKQSDDPCPGCRPGIVCRTPSCGRLKQRDGQP